MKYSRMGLIISSKEYFSKFLRSLKLPFNLTEKFKGYLCEKKISISFLFNKFNSWAGTSDHLFKSC